MHTVYVRGTSVKACVTERKKKGVLCDRRGWDRQATSYTSAIDVSRTRSTHPTTSYTPSSYSLVAVEAPSDTFPRILMYRRVPCTLLYTQTHTSTYSCSLVACTHYSTETVCVTCNGGWKIYVYDVAHTSEQPQNCGSMSRPLKISLSSCAPFRTRVQHLTRPFHIYLGAPSFLISKCERTYLREFHS